MGVVEAQSIYHTYEGGERKGREGGRSTKAINTIGTTKILNKNHVHVINRQNVHYESGSWRTIR